MAIKRPQPKSGESIEIRAKVKRLGKIEAISGQDIEAHFPPEKLPGPGSTIYVNDKFRIKHAGNGNAKTVGIEIYFTVQQQLSGTAVSAAISEIAKGTFADLRQATEQGARPIAGHKGADVTVVKALITHPMEPGNRVDHLGQLISAHFIQKVIFKHDENTLLTGQLGAGISRDPYLSFEFVGGIKGDKVSLAWSDNIGGNDSAEITIK